MNSNKLLKRIDEFVKRHKLQVEESNFVSIGGKVTTYRCIENSEIFYEIKHSKPMQEIGSKVRLYSKIKNDLRIKSKSRWFRKPLLEIDGQLALNTGKQIEKLTSLIGTFSWRTDAEYIGWPEKLNHEKKLVFECDDIEMAISELELIRQIHLDILNQLNRI